MTRGFGVASSSWSTGNTVHTSDPASRLATPGSTVLIRTLRSTAARPPVHRVAFAILAIPIFEQCSAHVRADSGRLQNFPKTSLPRRFREPFVVQPEAFRPFLLSCPNIRRARRP